MSQIREVGILGMGVVGNALGITLTQLGIPVRAFDIDESKKTHSLHDTLCTDLLFICLPEHLVEFFVDSNIRLLFIVPTVLKSTVPVGFTNRLCQKYKLTNFVHHPEFLSHQSSVHDTKFPKQFLIGYPQLEKPNPRKHVIEDFYATHFPEVPIVSLKSSETELIKLATNAFFGVKLNFLNLVHQLCEKHSISWSQVIEGMIRDQRIHPSHTKIPGPDGSYGFGGACLPKDMTQLINCFREQGIDSAVLHEVLSTNAQHRKRGKA